MAVKETTLEPSPSSEKADIEANTVTGFCSNDNEESQYEIAEHDGMNIISGWPLIGLFTGLMLAVFIVAVDFTILATAIPRITTDFHSLDDVGWYGSIYQLTIVACQPAFGKLYTIFDIKIIYLSAIMIFEIGSIIAATATSSVMLIVGRAVAGIGCSAVFSGGLTIIEYSVEPTKRPVYVGILSSSPNIASILGPILGGVLTERLSWRWCFWINLPIGAVTIVTILLCLHLPKRTVESTKLTVRLKEFDYLGVVLLMASMICLVLVLEYTGTGSSFSTGRVYGPFVTFVLGFAIFIFWEFRLGDAAAIPWRLMKERSVWSSSLLTCFLVMAFYDHAYYLPYYFQAVQDVGPQDSGVRSLPYFITTTIFSICTGYAISHLGTYVEFACAGSAVLTIAAGLIYTLDYGTGAGKWIGYQILAGLGAGLSLQVPFTAVQATIATADVPLALSIVILVNSLGGALIVAIGQSLFLKSLVRYLPSAVNAQSIIDAGVSGFEAIVPSEQLITVRQAYASALQNTFALAIGAAGLAFLISFRIKRASKAPR